MEKIRQSHIEKASIGEIVHIDFAEGLRDALQCRDAVQVLAACLLQAWWGSERCQCSFQHSAICSFPTCALCTLFQAGPHR